MSVNFELPVRFVSCTAAPATTNGFMIHYEQIRIFVLEWLSARSVSNIWQLQLKILDSPTQINQRTEALGMNAQAVRRF